MHETWQHQIAEISLGELARQLDIELMGDAHLTIHSVASLKSATKNDICFLQSASYLKQLQDSDCAAVIVPTGFDKKLPGKSLLFSRNPHLSFVAVINILQNRKGKRLLQH